MNPFFDKVIHISDSQHSHNNNKNNRININKTTMDLKNIRVKNIRDEMPTILYILKVFC